MIVPWVSPRARKTGRYLSPGIFGTRKASSIQLGLSECGRKKLAPNDAFCLKRQLIPIPMLCWSGEQIWSAAASGIPRTARRAVPTDNLCVPVTLSFSPDSRPRKTPSLHFFTTHYSLYFPNAWHPSRRGNIRWTRRCPARGRSCPSRTPSCRRRHNPLS